LNLPEEITFIHAEEAEQRYPSFTTKREYLLAKEYGAIFIVGIGGALKNGKPMMARAWLWWLDNKTEPGFRGLNGDIIVWNSVLEDSFEISSMGIRVDKAALLKQLVLTNTEQRKKAIFHRRTFKWWVTANMWGIGQSRLCMYFLRKAHIVRCMLAYGQKNQTKCKTQYCFIMKEKSKW